MSKKSKGLLIVLFSLFSLCLVFYFVVSSIPYFVVSEISLTTNTISGKVSEKAQEIISDKIGRNIFRINANNIKRNLKNTDCVTAVHVSKYYPDKLVINVEYEEFAVRMFTALDDSGKFYLASESGIVEVNQNLYSLYESLPEIQINYSYALVLQKWGLDQGFFNLLNLCANTSANDLITYIKYDNNKGIEFGCLSFDIPTLGVTVFVQEPVTPQELNIAVSILLSQKGEKLSAKYDLYVSGLFGRS